MFRRFGLLNPIEFYEATQKLFIAASRKYPRASVVFPVVGFTGLGMVLMEVATPKQVYRGDNETMAKEIFGNKQQEIVRQATDFDPYDQTEKKAREDRKKEAMGPEQRKVYEMLNGLKTTSREEKLNDAFTAMDHFMSSPKKNHKSE